MVCTLLAGVNVVAFAADDNDLIVSVNKFYNDATKGGDGEHLFTKDAEEMSWLKSLPTWNDEGEAWKAPVSSSTAVYRCYNPNSGEHLYVDEGYANYLAGNGWNKEKVAFYSDDKMGTPVYRLWNGLDGVGSHHFTTDESEVAWLVSQGWAAEDIAFYGIKEETGEKVTGVELSATSVKAGDTLTASIIPADAQNVAGIQWTVNGVPVEGANTLSFVVPATCVKGDLISVVVADTEGNTFEPKTKATVGIAAATIIDESGLQSDGTVLTNDTLRVTYTSDLGNPAQVTWYLDGTAVKTEVPGVMTFTYQPAKTGNVYATITNSKGDVFTSNTVTVTSKESLAVISDFSLAQDYEYGVKEGKSGATAIDYTDETDELVATFTINKEYTGLVAFADLDGNAAAPQALVGKTCNFTAEDDISKFTDEKAVEAAVESGKNGLKYVNTDGSVTYKWVAGMNAALTTKGEKAGTLTRGETYVLGFYQAAVSDIDDPTTFAWSDMPSVAPYLAAPVAILVGQSATDFGTMTGIMFIGSDGSIMKWMGGTKATQKTLNTLGFDSAELYGNNSKSTTGATSVGIASSLGGFAGTYGTLDDNYEYYYAEVATTEGVYGEESIELSSSITKKSEAIAKKVTWEENELVPTTATITFDTLRSDATVYIYGDKVGGSQTLVDPTSVTPDAAEFDPTNRKTYRGLVHVEEGEDSIDIPNVFVNDDIENNTSFTVVVIPDDPMSYLNVEDANTTSTITEVPASVKATSSQGWQTAVSVTGGTIVVENLTAYNQFGKAMITNAGGLPFTASVYPINKIATTTEKATAEFTVAAGGATTLTITPASTPSAMDVDPTDGFEVAILDKTLKITSNNVASGAWDLLKVVFNGVTVIDQH